MKKLNTIFQPLAFQLNSPFAKAEASCTHISCVNMLRFTWAYNIMMTRSIMQRYSNHVVRQNTVRCITSSATKSINTTQKRFCSAAKSINTTQKRFCSAAKSINTTQKRFCSAAKSIHTTQKRFCRLFVMQNTVICLTTFLKSRKDFVRSHFVCFADRQSICTHEYVLLADAKIRHSKQSTTLTDGQDHCVQISKKKLLLRGRRAVVIHRGELAEKVFIGACIGLAVRENFQQHGAAALLLD